MWCWRLQEEIRSLKARDMQSEDAAPAAARERSSPKRVIEHARSLERLAAGAPASPAQRPKAAPGARPRRATALEPPAHHRGMQLQEPLGDGNLLERQASSAHLPSPARKIPLGVAKEAGSTGNAASETEPAGAAGMELLEPEEDTLGTAEPTSGALKGARRQPLPGSRAPATRSPSAATERGRVGAARGKTPVPAGERQPSMDRSNSSRGSGSPIRGTQLSAQREGPALTFATLIPPHSPLHARIAAQQVGVLASISQACQVSTEQRMAGVLSKELLCLL